MYMQFRTLMTETSVQMSLLLGEDFMPVTKVMQLRAAYLSFKLNPTCIVVA